MILMARPIVLPHDKEKTINMLVTSYDRSIVLRRWGGAWIDFIAVASIFLLPDYFLGNPLYQKTLIGWIGVALVYFPITEGIWGKSLGKFIMCIKVVNIYGEAPGIGPACIRTLTRIVEVNPFLFGGIPAGLFVLFTSKRQRFGDILARTYVLKDQDLIDIISKKHLQNSEVIE